MEATLIQMELQKKRFLSFWWITALIVLLDQATKLRVRAFMEVGESFQVLGDFFRITYVTNTGAAFSMGIGTDIQNRLFFTVTTIIATALLLYLLRRSQDIIPSIAYLLILGGAIGNLLDRLFLGAVTDFLDFDFFDFVIARWPVFNIADSAITIAVILLLIDMVRSVKQGEDSETIPG